MSGAAMPRIIYRSREWEVPANITVRDAVQSAGLNPETVLAIRDGKLITHDTRLQVDDVIRLVATVAGG